MIGAGRYHGYIGYEVLAEVSRAPIRFRQELLDVVEELRPTVLEPTEASARLFDAYLATASFEDGRVWMPGTLRSPPSREWMLSYRGIIETW
jgi:hypothetical protein